MLLLMSFPITSASAETKGEEVVRIAKQYLGIPYLYGGTTTSGFDCSGFLLYVFNQVEIDLPRTSADQYNAGVPVTDMQPGDLVFFEKTYDKAGITHSGIYIGDNQFISATTSKGIKIDSLSSTYWGPKYVGAKRFIQNQGFKDVADNHLAFNAITDLTSKGVIAGFSDQTFRPESPVTRGQAAAIINRVLKKEPKSIYSFKDVSTSSSFAKDIAVMKESGIISGFSDGTYRPNAYMTRAEMAVIVKRAFQLEPVSIALASNPYTDVTPSYWAHDAIVVMKQIDTTTMFDTERYYSYNRATRALFSAAIYNSIDASPNY